MSTNTSPLPGAGTAPARYGREERDAALTEFNRPLDLTGRALLLATDGSEPSVAAAHLAQELAKRHHALVHVVSVVDTRSAPIPPPLDLALSMGDAMTDPSLHFARNEEIIAGISASLGEGVAWPVRTMLGTPASAIVQEARRLNAALIVVGLRQHRAIERAFQDETALEVMRHAPCPVLGVAATLTHLPRRVLVAIDFSDTSRLAARAACAVTAENGSVILAYVSPPGTYQPDEGARAIHDLGVQAGFMRTLADVAAPGRTLDHVVLHHESPRPTSELLLEEAEAANVDLIAAGSARHGRLDRWIMGSVSTELVRDGRWSVLVVPPRDKQ